MAEIPVQISQTWRVAKSENSAAVLRKVLAASGDLGPPLVTFLAMDSPVGAAVSATSRAVKKFPEVAPLATDVTLPGATESIPGLSTAAAAGSTRTLPRSSCLTPLSPAVSARRPGP